MRRVLLIVVSNLLLGSLVTLPVTAQGWDPCGDALNGVYPDGYEVVWAPEQGGSGRQIVLGSEGDDYLKGGSGDDILCGYGGNDVLEGDSGDDWLDAGTGSNELYGNSGDDTLIGMEGDVLAGHSGNNEIIANAAAPEMTVRVEWVYKSEDQCVVWLIGENFPNDLSVWWWWEDNAGHENTGVFQQSYQDLEGYFLELRVYGPEQAIENPSLNTEVRVELTRPPWHWSETFTYADDCASGLQ